MICFFARRSRDVGHAGSPLGPASAAALGPELFLSTPLLLRGGLLQPLALLEGGMLQPLASLEGKLPAPPPKTDLTQFRQECDKVCHRAVSALLFQLCSFSLAVSGLALPGTIVKSGRRTPAFSVAVSSTAPIPLRYRLQRRPLRYRLQRRARRLFARSRRRWQEGRPRRLGQFDSITARGPRRSDGYRNVWTH